MQALKGELWIVPQLGYETSSRSIGYGSFFHFGSGFLSGFSRLKVARFCKHNTGSLGASVSMALALEKQAIGNEFRLQDLDSEEDSPLEKPESVDGLVPLSRIENTTKINRVDVCELTSSLRHANTVDDADKILREKGDLPLQVYSTVIKGLGKEKLLGSAFAVFEWIKRRNYETDGSIGPNLFIYNSLLGAVKQSGKFGYAERVLSEMARDGISPNVVTFNTKMAIHLEQGQFSEALGVLEEMREKGLVPSPVSYSTAMLAYRRMEDGNGALGFFVEIREKYRKGEMGKDDGGDWKSEFSKLKNFTIRICYQVMRNWLVKEDNLSTEVLKLLTAMDNAGVSPGRSEHEKLLWACTREDHSLLAKELYERIRERHSDISLSVCNHVIWLMGKAKKWWTALEIYEDLLEKGPKPNAMSNEIIVSHFNVLLGAARKRGIWKWGVRLLDKMEEKGLEPGSKEWNAVLIACSKASEASAAVEIFKRMVERGQRPTVLSYVALLSALEKGKLYDEARRVWEHMVKLGVSPNVYAYTIMASVYAGQGKFNLVDAIFDDMASTGTEPTVVTYNAIISGCARNGMSGSALEWFHRMRARSFSPNGVTYETLVEALARDSKPRLAYEIYLRAQNEGIELGTKAYDALVESSKALKATIDLRLLGPRPPDK